MKVLLVLMFIALAAASALAYGNAEVTSTLTAAAVHFAGRSGEPAALLVSGSLLLGLAGAVKRFPL